MARAIVPVADLRRTPLELLPQNFDHHDGRDSQILMNEEIQILEIQGEWAHIAAIEQPRFEAKRGWHPYEGWVKRSEITDGKINPKFVISTSRDNSYGTYLETFVPGSRLIRPKLDRKQLVQEARLFLGTPYLWGGRASYYPGRIASVDCSSLINLLYRAQGILIPRDAHDQFFSGKPIATLQPGDPLYLAKEKRVNHVILKLEGDLFIEAPESGKQVRLLKEGKDVWQSKGRWHIVDRPYSYQGFFISLV